MECNLYFNTPNYNLLFHTLIFSKKQKNMKRWGYGCGLKH
nr:MAG TPA: hypothetical protein [Caudoviricetes sp.]